jgi:hypothetical protein
MNIKLKMGTFQSPATTKPAVEEFGREIRKLREE